MDLKQICYTASKHSRKLSTIGATVLLFSSSQLVAADNTLPAAGQISTGKIAPQQELPDLDGTKIAPTLNNVPENLTINQAIQRAVQWHPDIATAVGKLMQSADSVDVAKAKYYPQVNGGIDNGWSSTSNNHKFNPSINLSISQMLYDFGKVSSSVRAAEAGVAQQQASVLVSIDNVAHDTASTLVQVQQYQKLVAIAQEQLTALEKIGRLARERNDEGATSLSDTTQTDARIEGARSTLIQYQSALETSRAVLAASLGWPAVMQISDDFPVTLLKSCQIAKPNDRLNPSVLAAWAQANQAQAQLDNANAQMLPTISLEPQVTHYLTNNYADSKQMDRTQYSAYVKVQMPLYQGGALTAGRNAAAHALNSANAMVRSAQLTSKQKLNEAQTQALSLVTSLQILEKQQKLGEQTKRLYEEQYLQLGTRDLLDVLNAEQEIFQARFAHQQTVSQLRSLQLDCLYNSGTLRTAFNLNNQRIQSVEIQP